MLMLVPMLLAAVLSLALPARASAEISATDENALVKTYCAVCHTERAKNGGLSLEHYDAASVPSSLAAMMLSKITGLSLETLQAAGSSAEAKSLVIKKMKEGAMNAAGVQPPADAVTLALIDSLTVKAAKAHEWSLDRSETPQGHAPVFIASILSETASSDGESFMHRLVVTCDTNTRLGTVQLDWSPIPKLGTLTVTTDHRPPHTYDVQGIEKMGNGGSGKTTGRASMVLTERGTLPATRLVASGIFEEPVEFSFATMPSSIRHDLGSCFAESAGSR